MVTIGFVIMNFKFNIKLSCFRTFSYLFEIYKFDKKRQQKVSIDGKKVKRMYDILHVLFKNYQISVDFNIINFTSFNLTLKF